MATLYIANTRTEDMVGDLTALSDEQRRFAGAAAQRVIWFAKDEDIFVLARPPDDVFLDYVTSLTNTRRSSLRLIFPPAGEVGEEILSPDRLANTGFRTELRDVLATRSVHEVSPVYQDASVAALARDLGVEKALPGFAFSGQGGTAMINSKAVFRAVAAGLHAPLAPGAVVTGERDAVDAIETLLTTAPAAIVKQEHQVGGLGNEIISRVEGVQPIGAHHVVLAKDRNAVEDYVARRWEWLTGHRDNRVIVERYYPESTPVYLEYLLTDEGIMLLGQGEMLMSPVLSGIVAPAPSLTPELFAEMDKHARRLCKPFWDMGYRGVLTPDAFITPEGELMFSETNGRISGATHFYLAIAETMGGPERLGGRVFLERGSWQVPSFGAAVDRLEAAGIAFDPATGTGVVLACDMTWVDGTVRHCVVGEDLDHARALERQLGSLSPTSPAVTGAVTAIRHFGGPGPR